MEQAEVAHSEEELSLLLLLKEYQSASLPLLHGRKAKHSVTAVSRFSRGGPLAHFLEASAHTPEHALDHSPTWGRR